MYGGHGSRKLCTLEIRHCPSRKDASREAFQSHVPSRTQVSCPANAEQGMTFLPANDATGHNILSGKNGGVHNLVTCQPSTSDPLKFRTPPSTSCHGKTCTLPSTSVLWKISHASEYLLPSEYLDPLKISGASEYFDPLENPARFRVPRTFRVLRSFENLERCRVPRPFGNLYEYSDRCREIRAIQSFAGSFARKLNSNTS